MLGEIIGLIGSIVVIRATQAWLHILTWILPASTKGSQGAASPRWTHLCPDVTRKIYEHLSLADHARISHLSHEFRAASHVREAAAQERLLARWRTACSTAFLAGVGQALRSGKATYLARQIKLSDYYEFEEGELISHYRIPNPNFHVGQPVTALNSPFLPSSRPSSLQLQFSTGWCLSLIVARFATYDVGFVIGFSNSTEWHIWANITILWLYSVASPTVWLWVEPQHARSMLSLLGCACVDWMAPQNTNTQAPSHSSPTSQTPVQGVQRLLVTNTHVPSHSYPPSQTSVRGVRRLLRVVSPPPSQRGEGAGGFEDELLAGVSLLQRHLGNLRIIAPPSPWWVVCGFQLLDF